MPASSNSIRRLARLATVMQVAIVIGIVALVAVPIVAVFSVELTRTLLLAGIGGTSVDTASLPVRLLIASVMAVPAGVMLYGLVAAWEMFAEFRAGRVFTPLAVRKLQIFAAAVLAQAPLAPITSAVLSVLLTIGNPPGERMLSISISSHDYFAAVVGGVLLAAATIMREAARLAEDNAAIV